MSFEAVKQYFENYNMADRVMNLEQSSATVEEAANCKDYVVSDRQCHDIDRAGRGYKNRQQEIQSAVSPEGKNDSVG